MLKRFLPLFISVFIAALGCFAQKKDISSAKDMVKNNRDLSKAEMMMRTLLNDSNNRENTKIWDVLFDAVKKQYDNGNEQLYLKNKYDTTQLFVNARKMFEVYAAFDSIDARPNSHGQSRPNTGRSMPPSFSTIVRTSIPAVCSLSRSKPMPMLTPCSTPTLSVFPAPCFPRAA